MSTVKNTLILTVGLPRSGKSTWAISTGLPVVNPDSIRLALHGNAFIRSAETMVWTITGYMIQALFYTGHSEVILDATNLTFKARQKYEVFPGKLWDRVIFKVFTISKEVCIERAKATKRDDLIPIIEQMDAIADWPEDGYFCRYEEKPFIQKCKELLDNHFSNVTIKQNGFCNVDCFCYDLSVAISKAKK